MHIGIVPDTAFRYKHCLLRCKGFQLCHGVQTDFKGFQIPVVHTQNLRFQKCDLFQFLLIVHLYENFQPQRIRQPVQFRQRFRRQHGGDQKHCICPNGSRLVNLICIKEKILPQDRQRNHLPDRRQICGRALKVMLLRQAGNGTRSGGFIRLCNFHRLKICPNQSLGRGRFFHFTNAGQRILPQCRFQRNRLSLRQCLFRTLLHFFQSVGSLFPFQLPGTILHDLI